MLAIWGNYEDFLMGLATGAGLKIVELWELSESVGKLISPVIYHEKRDW